MIVFELICTNEHRFEGWFASALDFDAQSDRALLCCPICGSDEIRKLLTAKVGRTDRPVPFPGSGTSSQSTEKPSLAAVIDHVLLHTVDVGTDFPAEARRISNGEVPFRGIRGEASSREAEALRDEGIPVFSLPIPTKSSWN